MEKEIWKNIEGYEGLYQVSDQGRVKSLKYGKERILKPKLLKTGYLYVSLSKGKTIRQYSVHRLVALAFIPNPDNKPQVNHKSEQKWLNTVYNLEWTTAKENMNWGTRNKRASTKRTNGKKSTSIKQMTVDGNIVAIWPSMAEAERNGFNRSCICLCCQGKLNKHQGFKWKYL